MGHSYAVGFLALALCLFGCLSTSAEQGSELGEGTEIKREQAQEAVDDAKNTTTKVCERLGSSIEDVNDKLKKVESLKTQAAEIVSQAVQALPQADKAPKENKEATVTVENIKEISNTISASHVDAKNKLENTNATLEALLKEAETLKTECDNDELVIRDSTTNFKDINTAASKIKQKADKLDNSITTALTIMGKVESIEKDMDQNLTKAKLATLHVIGIVAVTEIDTMMGKANGIIQQTQNKMDAVNDIVQEIKNNCATELIESNEIIKNHCTSADNALISATGAVKQAQIAKAEMEQQKRHTDTALTNIQQKETDVAKAQNEADASKVCVTIVEQKVEQLNNALQIATTSLTNANSLKQKLKTFLSTTTTKPKTEQSKETEESDLPVQGGTDSHQKDTTIQPKSKDSPNPSDNSEDKLKDTLINGAQNVPTTALTGGKAPAPGANNDSAMTVSVPLLVALIASAVLQ